MRDAPWTSSLVGPWRFRYEPGPIRVQAESFAALTFDDATWDSIPVPSHWELQGYAEPKYFSPDEGTGYYRRSFTVPAAWNGRRVYVRFEGVLFGFDLWVNGVRVGEWQSGFNPVTFDITDAVRRDGSPNVMAVRVSTRSHGWKFDTNDDWALSGIYRDVQMFAAPEVHFNDFTTRTTLAADGGAALAIDVDASGPGTVRAKLLDASGASAGECDVSLESGGRGTGTIRVAVPQLWTAETPTLYTLELTFRAARDTATAQTISEKVGLREVSIRDGVLLLNGRPIKLRGVDHHDLEPDTGRVLSEEQMRRDLKLMRRANINFIRTSHYPSDPRFIQLCDELGFYVMCEVPFGMGDENLTDNAYQENLLVRARATVRRDHNRPSVIVWSVGNENPITPLQLETGREVKRLDPGRPICFPTVGSYFQKNYEKFPDWVDIYAPHYPSLATLRQYASELKKPVIVTEYAHAFGLATDLIQDEWEVMQASPRLAGGAIWHFHDQGLLRTAPEPISPEKASLYVWIDSRHYYDTGGNNGMDGIVYSDRHPQTDFWQVRHVYSPVWIPDQPLNFVSGKPGISLRVVNRFDFRSLAGIRLEWSLQRNRESLQSGTVELTAKTQEEETIQIPATIPAGVGSAVWALQVRIVDEKGSEVIARAWPLDTGVDRGTALLAAIQTKSKPGINIEKTTDGWTLTHERFAFEIDRGSGRCRLLDTAGKVLASGFGPHAGRRLTEAETVRSKTTSIWRRALLEDPVSLEINVAAEDGYGARVSIRGKFPRGDEPDQFLEGVCVLDVSAAGQISVEYDYAPVQGKGTLLEAGFAMVVPRESSEFRWIGQGPFAGYPGKDALNDFGLFHLNREDIRFNGNRRGVELAVLSRSNGGGVALSGRGMDIAVETLGDGIVVSHNAMVSGRGNKGGGPTHLVRADDSPRVSGKFVLYPLIGDEDWPVVLRDWFGSPTREAESIERPYYRSYDQ